MTQVPKDSDDVPETRASRPPPDPSDRGGAGSGAFVSELTPPTREHSRRDDSAGEKSASEGTEDHLVGEVEPGRILFNRYLVEKKLGEGGMGTVWLVRHIELDVLRALKLIVSGIAFDPQAQARFKREARVMARLSHPNVVAVYDARMAKDAAFIEMEFIKGQSLNKLLKPGVAMPLDWTARILDQLCDVLQEAHAHKVVHRDLKPANLMLVDGRPPGKEQLKVLDFGIAKILGGDLASGDFRTNPGDFMGSAPWSSPEQASAAPIDARSDLYAVGVILYELLTGYRPFSGPIIRVLYNHVNTPPPSFAERNPSVVVPPMVERVVMRCLAKNPDDRPQSARELAEELAVAFSSAFKTRSPDRPMTAETLLPVPKPDRGGGAIGGPPSPRTTLPLERHDEEVLPTGRKPPAPLRTGAEEPEPEPHVPPDHHPRVLFYLRRALLVVGLFATGVLVVRLVEVPVPVPPIFDKIPVVPPIPPMGSLPPGYERAPESKLVNYWPTAIVRKKDGTRFVRYSDKIYLPEGYECDTPGDPVPGWPQVISRKGTRFIKIKRGKFRMGVLDAVPPQDQDKSPKGQPVPTLDVPWYYLQETEVTNGEMVDFFEAQQIEPEARPKLWREAFETLEKKLRYELKEDVRDKLGEMGRDPKRYPAVGITYEIAERYARWVGGQLPTEAQWEYAARSGGKPNRYVWGNVDPDPEKGWANIDQFNVRKADLPTASVKSFPRDRTEQGIYDMTGNVREWCRVVRISDRAPQDSDGAAQHVIRGGWFEGFFDQCTTTRREDPLAADQEALDLGFRVAIECPPDSGFGPPP